MTVQVADAGQVPVFTRGFLGNPSGPTAVQVDALIRSAVTNLCPTEKAKLP